MADSPAPTVRALVVERRLVPDAALARAVRVQEETGDRFEAVLTRLGLMGEGQLTALLAEECGLGVASADMLAAAPRVAGVSAAFLRDALACPVAVTDAGATVAFANPLDGFTAEALSFALGRPVRRLVARASDIETALDALYGADEAAAPLDGMADEADLERLKDLSSDAPAIRAVNRLIAAAVEARASDIHVEPNDHGLSVRLRVDGLLREQEPLPATMRSAFVSRVKIMAGLNIAEKRLPQDGRLRLAVRGHDIDLRVATAPSIHGESVVLRILDRSSLPLDFRSLGFDEAITERFLPIIHRPNGIVLVTGPTGSGKTTTLYAALSDLNQADRKLLTVEDPVEYRLPGIVQTQVAPAIGLDFAAALRSFLRQDPDVIMVGEIRDGETAQVAVQAALTGHTILSTLHTIGAAASVTRLLDMGVEPFLITSTLNAVLAQRLARRLCPDCAETHIPPPSALAPFGAHAEPLRGQRFGRAVGCSACRGTGYRGRIAVLELLIMSEAVADLVLARAEAREIERAGVAGGMRPLVADGLAKAQAGLTTLEEVLRVVVAG